MGKDIGFTMFGAMDELISLELNVSSELYTDVIENRCTSWEARFIILSLLSNKEDKKQKAIKLFNEKI